MRRSISWVGICGLSLCSAWGCNKPTKSAATVPLEPDIVEAFKYYTDPPWLSFDENDDPNPEGFKVTLYLTSAKTGRGAFGDGDIIVTLFSHAEQEPNQKARPEPKMEKRWILDPEAAMPYRAKKPSVQGYGYGLRLNWGDIDLFGKLISVHIDFRRADGRIIKSQPRSLRVPARKDYY